MRHQDIAPELKTFQITKLPDSEKIESMYFLIWIHRIPTNERAFPAAKGTDYNTGLA